MSLILHNNKNYKLLNSFKNIYYLIFGIVINIMDFWFLTIK